MKTQTQLSTEAINNLKAYVKPGSLINFPSPTTLLQKSELANNNIFFRGIQSYCGSGELINLNDDKSENKSFERFNIIHSYKIDEELEHQIGLLYAFDLNKPIVKVYSGIQVSACLNLKIFSATDIIKFDFTNNQTGGIEQVQKYLAEIEEKIAKAKKIITFLKSVIISEIQFYQIVGCLLTQVVEQKNICGKNAIIAGLELMCNEKIEHYFYKQNNFNAWLLLNSFTEYYTTKTDLLDVPEKTLNLYLLLNQILHDTPEYRPLQTI